MLQLSGQCVEWSVEGHGSHGVQREGKRVQVISCRHNVVEQMKGGLTAWSPATEWEACQNVEGQYMGYERLRVMVMMVIE